MEHISHSQATSIAPLEAKACLNDRKASSTPPSARQTPQRHREGGSRGPRRSMHFDRTELEELVQTSAIVPTGDNVSCKQSADWETNSTVAPSSTEASPMLSIVADVANMPAWPSLREAPEARSGWDFCNEQSDSEWEDLPEPALAMEELGLSEITMASKLSYADSVRCPSAPLLGVLPPASGTRMPPMRMKSSQLDACKVMVSEGAADSTEEHEHFEVKTQRGWKKQHKDSRSKKQQRKVADQVARRKSQSCQSRREVELED